MNLETAQEVIDNWGSEKDALKFLRSCVELTEDIVTVHNHNLKLIEEIEYLILKKKAKDVRGVDKDRLEELYNNVSKSTKIKGVNEFFERIHDELMKGLDNHPGKETLKNNGVYIGKYNKDNDTFEIIVRD